MENSISYIGLDGWFFIVSDCGYHSISQLIFNLENELISSIFSTFLSKFALSSIVASIAHKILFEFIFQTISTAFSLPCFQTNLTGSQLALLWWNPELFLLEQQEYLNLIAGSVLIEIMCIFLGIPTINFRSIKIEITNR